jgi:ABC-type thiamin/hydroxymethylpyrimidine transport system permease subunit
VGTIKALASEAIFIITKVRARAIKGIILRVINIRLFRFRTY